MVDAATPEVKCGEYRPRLTGYGATRAGNSGSGLAGIRDANLRPQEVLTLPETVKGVRSRRCGCGIPSTHPFVTGKGIRITEGTLRRRLKKVDVKPRDLRRTFGTWHLRENRDQLIELAELMGLSNLSQVRKYTLSDVEAGADRAGGALAASLQHMTQTRILGRHGGSCALLTARLLRLRPYMDRTPTLSPLRRGPQVYRI